MKNSSGPHLFFGFYWWKNHWHFQGPIIKWKSVYLRANYSNDWLLTRRLFCNQDTAMCTHKLKWHSVAAPNSSLSLGILWHEGGTTKYCICLSKMEGSWEFKRKCSCQLVLFKTWIRTKILGRQGQLSTLWEARRCFCLREFFFCSEHNFFPLKN